MVGPSGGVANAPAAFGATRVGDAMNGDVVSCPPDMPLRAVAALMARNRIHSVVVFDDAPERAWGIVSDLDVVTATSGDLDAREAREVAGTPVVTVTPQEGLARAAQLMSEYQTTHLIVVDPATGRPTGVLSSLDVARVLART
ncbi:MAG: CBS domain-containing protein [Actinomycetota bacterium]